MSKIADHLPGIVLPLVMLYFFFVIPLRRVRRARSWRKTPCVILSSSVSEDATDFTAGHRGKKRVANRLGPGTTTFCYVNPDDPDDAVIERGVTWDMVVWGALAIVFLGVFSFFLGH